jgi:hypothetical protein
MVVDRNDRRTEDPTAAEAVVGEAAVGESIFFKLWSLAHPPVVAQWKWGTNVGVSRSHSCGDWFD